MKKIVSSFLLVFSFVLSLGAQQVMTLEGTYQGQNLYVKNPFASSGVGFCVINVTVNGQQSIDEINSSAFEIDFASYQLTKGAAVEIKIEYKDDCTPTVLNPDVLRPTSTYVITKMDITPEGLLTFSTTNESGELPFIIEQKRWNKWVKVGKIQGKGTSGTNNYSIKLKPHSGKNIFRIKQVDYTGNPRYSAEKRLIRSATKEVFLANENPQKIEGAVLFKDSDGNSTETMYEVFNETGLIIKQGFGSKIDMTGLEKGVYFVNFDSKSTMIKKI